MEERPNIIRLDTGRHDSTHAMCRPEQNRSAGVWKSFFTHTRTLQVLSDDAETKNTWSCDSASRFTAPACSLREATSTPCRGRQSGRLLPWSYWEG